MLFRECEQIIVDEFPPPPQPPRAFGNGFVIWAKFGKRSKSVPPPPPQKKRGGGEKELVLYAHA